MGCAELKNSSLLTGKRRLLFSSITVLLAAVLVFPVNTTDQVSAYTPRGPILIEGNGNFTVENGVVSGNGTWDDPYIIERWEIDNFRNFSSAIEIRNTSAHFVIRYSHLIGMAGYPWESSGI
ncbi:MAG: hypothetical protein KAW09_09180, partial [Thermoplasmata archaeon]|nr:hypothetical protein [Thermoplasmata archaeon]